MAYNDSEKTEIVNRICENIEKNKDSLRNTLLLDNMPSMSTFLKWINEDAFKQNQYAHACEVRADAIFDEMLEIADDGTNDYMEKIRRDGTSEEVLNSEHVQRSKLRIDARKWMLSKMNPKKYGDKLDLTTDNKSLNKRPTFVFIDKVSKK
jgi:hypothetical protein